MLYILAIQLLGFPPFPDCLLLEIRRKLFPSNYGHNSSALFCHIFYYIFLYLLIPFPPSFYGVAIENGCRPVNSKKISFQYYRRKKAPWGTSDATTSFPLLEIMFLMAITNFFPSKQRLVLENNRNRMHGTTD